MFENIDYMIDNLLYSRFKASIEDRIRRQRFDIQARLNLAFRGYRNRFLRIERGVLNENTKFKFNN